MSLPISKFINITDCVCCPRRCEVDRTKGQLGWCRLDDKIYISSICCHRGEEPVISGSNGVCNIFFEHCNMQCRYCQNYQISRRRSPDELLPKDLNEIVNEISLLLAQGAQGVGFVSPSHSIYQMLTIIDALNQAGMKQPYIYNTNGYDRPEVIKALEPTIDVYLPDLKYMDNLLGLKYSDTPGYVEHATAAITEMFRQTGADIILNDDGYIQKGMIIRHLVLPGHIENSKEVLRFIAEELSTDVHISLMSQYYPTYGVRDIQKLNRTLTADEYDEVLDEFDRLGFHRGFVQELSSSDTYRPDFDKDDHPFE